MILILTDAYDTHADYVIKKNRRGGTRLLQIQLRR